MEKSPFSKLSPELRNAIWEMAVVSEVPIRIDVKNPMVAAPPAITQVCKEVRSETRLMFYGMNDFIIIVFRGEEKESAAKSDKSTDRIFARSAKSAVRWLNSVEMVCHRVVRSLELRPNIAFWCIKNDMKRRSELWEETLGRTLKRCEYASPRFRVVVNMLDAKDPLLALYWSTRQKMNTVIGEHFRGVGLEVSRVATESHDFGGNKGEFVDWE